MAPDYSYIKESFADPDFRPNREAAKNIYRDIIKSHILTVQPDQHCIDQEMIELVIDSMDVSQFIISERGLFAKITRLEQNQNTHEINQLETFIAYHKHFFICSTLNRVRPDLAMFPVLGSIVYHWHGRGDEAVFFKAGSSYTDEEARPVVWSESAGARWQWTEEASNNVKSCSINREPFYDINSKVPISIGWGFGATDPTENLEEPLRFDTVLKDISRVKTENKRMSHLELPEIAIHPMFRGICGIPKFRASGSETSRATRWNTPNMKKDYKLFGPDRIKAYKHWRGE